MANDHSALNSVYFGDLERELAVTRKVLAALPEEHYQWKAHEKSMSLGQLALHVSDLPDWMWKTLDRDVLDASQAPRGPKQLTSRAELLARFDANAAGVLAEAAKFDASRWNDPWTMRNGEQVIVTKPRSYVYRVWSVNHMIHHRGQLCVYLRLLNVPVPTVYFNTADDPSFVFE